MQTTANLAYDGNGSITGDGTWVYVYDAENRLISAVGQGSTVTFEYDPLGRRSAKVVDGVRTEYLSDGVEEIADYDAAGAILRRYVHGPGIDEPVVMYTGAGTTAKQYYHANYQGSVIAMTDTTGVAVDIYTYDPHGNSTTLTGNPFRYTGRRLDAETGLYCYRARYYSPALGRFLQTDPIGYGDGLNWYAYVGNDPVNGTDPSGEVKVNFGISAELVAKIGFRAGIDLSFDTKTLEVGAAVSGGARVGFSAGIGLSGSLTKSGADAKNSLDASVALNADIGIGPVSVGTDIISASTRDGIQVLGDQSIDAMQAPEAGLDLKVGGSVGIDVTVEATTSVVSDAFNSAAEAIVNIEISITCGLSDSCNK